MLYVASALLICIPAIRPLFSNRMTCGYDNVFHLWRAVQVEHMWEQGLLFSRWAPDMAGGAGLPLFTFVSPLSAAVAALFRQLDLSWAVALNATFALGIVAGGLFAFLLARDLFGPAAGLVATAAYVYAPYQAYEAFFRGSLWESFAWAFPPLVLWGIHKWTVESDRRFLALGAVALCALIVTHQLFAFLFAPLFVAWTLGAAVAARSWRPAARGVVLGLLGLGMSAFYWFPGLAERGYVQTGRLLGTWVFDFRNNFLTVAELFALPRNADPTLINDWPPKTMGLIPFLLALLPLARWRWLDRPARWQTLALLLVLVVACFMTLPASRVIWEVVPLLEYVQFPWRFLGPAVLCVALLGAAGVTGSAAEAPRAVKLLSAIGPALLIPTLWLTGLGWFHPRTCNTPRDTTVAGMIAWERATDTIGTTAKGEYLPVWVGQYTISDQLDRAYSGDVELSRLDLGSLPEGSSVLSAEYGPTHGELELESPDEFTARYLVHYYPGWQVTLDGESLPVEASAPEGYLSFGVPSGRHQIEVRFGKTPASVLGEAIALLSVGLLIGMLVWPLMHGARSRREPAA